MDRPGLTLGGIVAMIALNLLVWVPVLLVTTFLYRYMLGRTGHPGLAAVLRDKIEARRNGKNEGTIEVEAAAPAPRKSSTKQTPEQKEAVVTSA